jgi:hypothetical protein
MCAHSVVTEKKGQPGLEPPRPIKAFDPVRMEGTSRMRNY